MRFRDALTPILAGPTRLGVLRTLFADPDRRWTGRELARAAGVSVSQCARDLGELAETSLVTREVVGKAYAWQLNMAHALGPALAELFRREAGLRGDLQGEISDVLRPSGVEKARLFGSIPRGDERADSDIDLFLQVQSSSDRTRAEEAIDRLRASLWARFGNPVSALIYTRSESARARGSALLKRVEEEGVDLLAGG